MMVSMPGESGSKHQQPGAGAKAAPPDRACRRVFNPEIYHPGKASYADKNGCAWRSWPGPAEGVHVVRLLGAENSTCDGHARCFALRIPLDKRRPLEPAQGRKTARFARQRSDGCEFSVSSGRRAEPVD
jgi:hypothetical protein